MPKLTFETNIPLEVCLTSLDGEPAQSQFGGDQRKYTTTDRDFFYVSEPVGNIIADTCRKLRIDAGEPVVICKAEVPDGRGRKQIRWTVNRVGPVGPQPDGTFSVPNGNGANGSHPPAPVAPTTQVQQQPVVANRNSSAAQAQVNGRAAAPAERPKTKLEDALKTVVAACHAAREYAKQIGYEAMPPFSSEDIRTMANTLMIQNGNGGAH